MLAVFQGERGCNGFLFSLADIILNRCHGLILCFCRLHLYDLVIWQEFQWNYGEREQQWLLLLKTELNRPALRTSHFKNIESPKEGKSSPTIREETQRKPLVASCKSSPPMAQIRCFFSFWISVFEVFRYRYCLGEGDCLKGGCAICLSELIRFALRLTICDSILEHRCVHSRAVSTWRLALWLFMSGW